MQKSKKLQNVFKETAKKHDIPMDNMTSEMQKVIEIGWSSSDPLIRAKWDKLFPNGKPTVDEFLCVTSKEVSNRSL